MALIRISCSKFRPYLQLSNFVAQISKSTQHWPISLCSHLQPQSYFSTKTSSSSDRIFCHEYNLVSLQNRSIISVTGSEACDFMQGLITNDIRHLLDNGSTSITHHCIYTFMLNTLGRILADLFIYRFPTKTDEILIEADKEITVQLIKLLKRYKIRRKINIKQSTEWKVFALIPNAPENTPNENIQIAAEDKIVVQDPRNNHFGFRILTSKDLSPDECGSFLAEQSDHYARVNVSSSGIEHYDTFRYQNGFGEGIRDFPPESCFPFESNAEILNGVSFQKGCYVGQELTARIYHTGVIRKRLMPIEILDDVPEQSLPVQNILNSDGKTMGRFRVNYQQKGLATLKFGDLLSKDAPDNVQLKLSQSGQNLRTWKPFWWPKTI